MPTLKDDEDKKSFIERCVPKIISEGKDPNQAIAICYSMYNEQSKSEEDYIIVDDISSIDLSDHEDDFSDILYSEEKKKLNKPFRTPDGPKKFSVYVKNDKGNIVKVNFGDQDMEIKRDDPERRKSYRARHNCDNPGPKWKANYWSCKMWSETPVKDIAATASESLIEVETKMCVETCGTYSDGVITILSEEESAKIATVSVSEVFNMMKLDPSKKYEFKIEVEECD